MDEPVGLPIGLVRPPRDNPYGWSYWGSMFGNDPEPDISPKWLELRKSENIEDRRNEPLLDRLILLSSGFTPAQWKDMARHPLTPVYQQQPRPLPERGLLSRQAGYYDIGDTPLTALLESSGMIGLPKKDKD